MSPRLCLCGCGQPVPIPRRKDGYRVSMRSVPVRYYASRACSSKVARAARASAVAQRQRLAVHRDWAEPDVTACAYCGEDVIDGRELHRACAMRQARAARWTRGPHEAKQTVVWKAVA